MTLGDKPNIKLEKQNTISRKNIENLIIDRMDKFRSKYDESHGYSDQKFYDTLYKYESVLIKKYPENKRTIKGVVKDIEDGTFTWE